MGKRIELSKVIIGAVIGIIASIILMVVTYSVGKSTKFNDQVVDASAQIVASENLKMNSENEKLRNETESLKKDIDTLSKQISDNKALISDMRQYQSDKGRLEENIKSMETRLQDITNLVTEKQQELDKITNGIIQKKNEPKVLPAGYFEVGTDIEPGRYSVSGKSNFVVYDSTGDLKVNTILGDGRFGVENYVCRLETGDQIEAAGKFTYTPIE